ncbi:hypothetical protein B0T19DRAFT_472190 [Cercophora scortea]|uniref:Uncharacterized protein n=1 Tax=Cercophora scortea TaxID=314031 RepID=A0AAE0J664_9PEZI|nr:hypothetical protein B0T19DRAFT_472190 [Cercophora scortea]
MSTPSEDLQAIARSIEFELSSFNSAVEQDVGGPENFVRETSFSLVTSKDSLAAEAQLTSAWESRSALPWDRHEIHPEETDQDAKLKFQADGVPCLPNRLAQWLGEREDVKASEAPTPMTINMGEYMIITAVTQNAINNSLLTMAKTHRGIQGLSAANGKSSFNGTVKHLSVELDTTKAGQGYLYLNFKKGTAELSPTPASKDQETGKDVKKYKMAKWKLVFAVDISSLAMSESDSDRSDVASQVSNATSYSLLRLILDLATANPKEYISSKLSIPDVDSERLTTFLHLVDIWCQSQATAKEKQTFAYAWTTTNPQRANYMAPTFAATSLKLQTHKSSQASSTKDSIPGGRNLLLYLEMALNKAMPQRAFSSSAELVAEGYQGSMFLCRSLFWDRYLLDPNQRILEKVNEWTDITAISARCEYSFLGSKTAYFVYKVGRDWSKDVSSYKWNPLVGNIWYWWDSPEKTATAGNSFFGMKAQLICYVRNFAYVHDTGDIISLFGTSSISEQTWAYTSGITNWTHVESGKLGISVSEIKSEVKKYKDSGWFMPVDDMERDLRRIIGDVQLESMRREVETSLSGNTGFVLPGGNQFFQKDPRVSNYGDLVVKLTYKNKDDESTSSDED